MKIQTMVAGLALLALPAVASAQATVGADAALRATVEADLPEAPVRRVIAEGEAKGASEAEIGRAAMRVHHRLRVASEALARDQGPGGRASDAEIVAGAEAMAAGATVAELRALRSAASSGGSLTASLNALAGARNGGAAGGAASGSGAAALGAGGALEGLGAAVGAGASVTGSLGATLGL